MPSVFLLRRTRQALLAAQRALFEPDHHERWRCVGGCDSLHEALPRIAASRPDVVATDLRLLDGHALGLLRRLGAPRPRVLLLSPESDDPLLFEALAAGAQGYWLDPGRAQGLAAGLSDCQANAAQMSPALARQALEALGLARSEAQQALSVAAAQDPTPLGRGLARSDQHLLTLVAQGLLVEEIMQRWQLGRAEIGRRLAAVYAALHRRSSDQAVGGALSAKL